MAIFNSYVKLPEGNGSGFPGLMEALVSLLMSFLIFLVARKGAWKWI
jgi:hypothetical protein